MPDLKRKIFPLLGIAFVVAIIATGVFYGLFVGELKSATTQMSNQFIVVAAKELPRGKILVEDDLKVSRWAGAEPLKGAFAKKSEVIGKPLSGSISENEPITESRVISAHGSSTPIVPTGMRAVSIRVQESSGIMPFLKSGNRIDVQMVSGNNTLRTILENVEVLSVNTPESNVPGGLMSVISLLVTPAEADRAALADSTAKIRLLLRNPLDKETSSRSAVDVGNMLRESRTSMPAPLAVSKDAVQVSQNRVEFLVRVVGASSAGLEMVRTKLATTTNSHELQVSALRPGSNADEILQQLSANGQAEMLSTARLISVNDRQVIASPGSAWAAAQGLNCGILLNLQPSISGSSLRVRVQPEITTPRSPGQGVESRKIVSEVLLNQPSSFVITGWVDAAAAPQLLGKLFPTSWKQKENRDLVVVVTPSWHGAPVKVSLNRPQ